MNDMLLTDEPETDDDVAANGLVLAAMTLVTYAIHSGTSHGPARTLVIFVGFAAVLARQRLLRSWWAWGLVTAAFVVDVARNPYGVANHHYVLTYIAAAGAVSLGAGRSRVATLLAHNGRWFVAAIMGFAVVHKLTSPNYVTGVQLSHMLAHGQLAETVWGYCDRCTEIVAANGEVMRTLLSGPPTTGYAPLESPFGGIPLVTLGKLGAFGVILGELWVGLAFALAPRHRVTHASMLLFACGLAVVRHELVFIATLCVLGVWTCPAQLRTERRLYAFCVPLLAALAIVGAGT
ncbi:MAG: hypothetical protein K0V04_16545 [Deltaproteobacteria bacterium]|nr:hypothetical protein [Deltaproteobacteria bacterium]